MESHGEVVRRLVNTHGVPWTAWCVDIPTEYHEKLAMVDSLMECHEECMGVSALSGIGTLWRICMWRMRPTVE